MNPNFKINSPKITIFLNQLTEAETIYITHIVEIASQMRYIVQKYELTKERFCEEMGIKKNKYQKYMKGTAYDLKDMAKLNALSSKLIIENAEKLELIKVAKK